MLRGASTVILDEHLLVSLHYLLEVKIVGICTNGSSAKYGKFTGCYLQRIENALHTSRNLIWSYVAKQPGLTCPCFSILFSKKHEKAMSCQE